MATMDKDEQVRALMEKVRMLEAQLVQATSPKPAPETGVGGDAPVVGSASGPSSPPRREAHAMDPAVTPLSTPGDVSVASNDGDLEASAEGGAAGAGAGVGGVLLTCAAPCAAAAALLPLSHTLPTQPPSPGALNSSPQHTFCA
jgi:hypothetical protein